MFMDINWQQTDKISRKYTKPKQKYCNKVFLRGGGYFFDSLYIQYDSILYSVKY